MKILVTGGAGFIGSHIVDLALEHGHEVVIVDDLSTGSAKNLNPAATFCYLNINDAALESVLMHEKPEVVCHQAAQTNVTRSMQDPLEDARTNIRGSLNVLDKCIQANVKKVVYASSCAIYGDPDYLPVDEKHRVHPLSHYGVSKFTVEQYLDIYRAVHGLAFVALRYSNVFGPRQTSKGEAGVVALFARKMLNGDQPTIFGSGSKTRSYVYVEDIARANLIAMEAECQGIFNIGTQEQTTDQTVFDSLARELDYPDCARYEPVRPGEISHMCLDCRQARQELGWSPEVSFAEGIHSAAEYYKSVHKSKAVFN